MTRHTADSITDDELDALYAQLAALRGAAESMAVRPPNGLNPRAATDESPRTENGAQAGARGSAVLTVVVTAPTQENAGQWAATIRDLISAEYGDAMRLHMTITPSAANRPGSTAEQLPDHVLALLPPAEYTSTACETAARLEGVALGAGREELRGEVAYWVRWLYERCRLNHKFTGELCASPSHRQAEDSDATEEGR